MRKSLRAAVVRGLAIKKFGGCATTALLCKGYLNRDPLLTHAIQNVTSFIETVILCPPSFRMALEKMGQAGW